MATSSAATPRPQVTPVAGVASARDTVNITGGTRIQRSQEQTLQRIESLRQQRANKIPSKVPGVTQAPLPSETSNHSVASSTSSGVGPQNTIGSQPRPGGNVTSTTQQSGASAKNQAAVRQAAVGGVAGKVIQKTPAGLAASRVLRNRQTKTRQSRSLQESTVSLFLYLPAMAVAMFKDLLDFVFIGSLPVIGTVITAGLSFLIFALLFLTGSKNQTSRRVIVLGLTTIVEGIFFGINFFPLETAAVFVIYYLDRNSSE